ncbi:V-type proton ATPase subunit E1 [Porphyridium purpureum]|uniref:V-type proton ATPase subunit E1 n=1 Tax=Porphyridium purpureum TaxID=35688 RepID=A0A5J4YYV0_PORPP|nr:V-type proton ATPase subunit E1 [Porphyridium purpureum]|eukprot:POR3560..scf209_3
MNDQQVRQQIQQMVSFIRQEADEKANEILVKAEEEFNIRKLSAVEAAREKIRAEYEKKNKQIAIYQKIQNSTELNAARLKVLKEMDAELQALLGRALEELVTISKDKEKYSRFLHDATLQGLIALADERVVLKVRLEDAPLLKAVLPQIEKEYTSKTGKKVALSIDGSTFLDEKSAGGVVLSSNEGRIVLDNTFASRLNIAYEQNLPVIRTMLFGGSCMCMIFSHHAEQIKIVLRRKLKLVRKVARKLLVQLASSRQCRHIRCDM